MTAIGKRAFPEGISLSTITVDPNNTVYHSSGNCLIETASKTLLVGCKNSKIPADGSVTTIGSYAFYDCFFFNPIIIPKSITIIDDYAFYNYDYPSVFYTGTAAEWEKIEIGSYNDSLTDATRYYYSKEQPTDGGNYWRYVDGKPTVWR